MIKYKRIKTAFILYCICSILVSCENAGQIGDSTRFRADKENLEAAIDSLYKNYPQYKIPSTWEKYKNIPMKTSMFTENKFFYFKSQPEELYCVTLVDDSAMAGDSARSRLAIRAVNRGDKWVFEDHLAYKDEKTIAQRFDDEIITKIKMYAKVKVAKGE